jgi:beta-glucosidase
MGSSGHNLKFPKKFLWGAATSSHQVEGGTHNQWTVWELESAASKAKLAVNHESCQKNWANISKQASNPGNYVSGSLANHYKRYREDFDILTQLNMNAYRFSVEWSRIEPEEGEWDKKAIQHYRDYVEELRNRNIEPILTLFHFTLPVWFANLGGFEKRANVKYFSRFAKKIVEELGSDVKYVITVNEPEVYAVQGYFLGDWPPEQHSVYKTWRVLNNLALAHREAAKAIRRLGMGHKISIAKNSSYFYPGDDSWLSRLSVRVMQYMQDDYVLKKVVRHCDFLGVNYYVSQRVYGYRIHNPPSEFGDLDWGMYMEPSNIQFVLERLYKKYKLPIIITENGIADNLDVGRKEWITQTLEAMQKAMKHGVKLAGYLHWSLIDNFELAFGKWPRFGLVHINYATGKRTIRPSAVWFGKIIGEIRGKSSE